MRTQKAAIYVHAAGLKPELRSNRFDEHELGELVFEKEPGITE